MSGLFRRIDDVSSTLGALMDNLLNTPRGVKQAVQVTADAVIAVLTLWLAISFRYQTLVSPLDAWSLYIVAPLSFVLVNAGMGVYKNIVRYSLKSLSDSLIKSAILSSVAVMVVVFLLLVNQFPRSSVFIYCSSVWALSQGYRYFWYRTVRHKLARSNVPVALYGAGAAGGYINTLFANSDTYEPKVFIDDDAKIVGQRINGLRILSGQSPTLADDLKARGIKDVILAMPSVDRARRREIIIALNAQGLRTKVVGSIADIARHDTLQLRDASVDDLVGRSEVPADVALIDQIIKDKVILVTGGGGSIGSEICRQALTYGCKQLIMLDKSEENLYQINEELGDSALANMSGRVIPVLGSILHADQVEQICRQYGVEVIFHAAAYKHVPIVERYPLEAVYNNVLGTKRMVEVAERVGVEKFILISTDKAVRPTNFMGATKRLAEKVLLARASTSKVTFAMVRFGNVINSSGSVIPKFEKQVEQGGPLTVTHPDVTRYFMTIPEAAELVIQAGAMAKGGEVFLLTMGNPVKIAELARTVIQMKGLPVAKQAGDEGILIQFTGLRPGEKLYEELLVGENTAKTTDHPKIFKALDDSVDAQFWPQLEQQIEQADASKRLGNFEQMIATHVEGYKQSATPAVIKQ